MIDPMVYVILGINLVGLGARHIRAEAQGKDNTAKLVEIGADVKRINGTVARHDEVIEYHGHEIERLRDRSNHGQ